MRGIATQLRDLLESGVNAVGFAMVDAELVGHPRHPTLRVYIDGPEGVNIDDCAKVSRQLSAVLDVENPLSGRYNLEVSSPGLDRPLVKLDDFRRFVGETVKVRLCHAVVGRKNFTGRLMGVAGGQVVLEGGGAPGGVKEQFHLEFADIDRARLVPKF